MYREILANTWCPKWTRNNDEHLDWIPPFPTDTERSSTWTSSPFHLVFLYFFATHIPLKTLFSFLTFFGKKLAKIADSTLPFTDGLPKLFVSPPKKQELRWIVSSLAFTFSFGKAVLPAGKHFNLLGLMLKCSQRVGLSPASHDNWHLILGPPTIRVDEVRTVMFCKENMCLIFIFRCLHQVFSLFFFGSFHS